MICVNNFTVQTFCSPVGSKMSFYLFWVLVQNTGIPKNQQFQDGKKSDNHSKIKVGEILFRNQCVEKMSVALIYKQG